MQASDAIITATDLFVRYNEQIVLDHASCSIVEGQKIGLVGRNGSGKTTAIRILIGQMQPDAGTVSRRRDLSIGYLPQEMALDPARTVLETIQTGAQPVLDLIQRFETLPPDSDEHAELEQQILSQDGWTLDTRIKVAMEKLGVPDGQRIIGTLSGGEQRRVALCRALISEPQFLVLDEPTNHLDTESIQWLQEHLQQFKGTLLLVTHDRAILEALATHMIELSRSQFVQFRGNYSNYLLARIEREAALESMENKRLSFLRRELDWVRRGPKARTTKSKARLDRYADAAGTKAHQTESQIDPILPPTAPLPNRILELNAVEMQLGSRRLIQDLTFDFKPDMRLGVIGRNGAGKSTLLRVMAGELEPTSGSVFRSSALQINYVDQNRSSLRDDQRVLDEISEGTDHVQFGNQQLSARAYLKRFLFTDDRINTTVGKLSGGERSRLALASALKTGGNFLILDEPTNDLDLSTLRVLEESLSQFQGCLVVVSHDRFFLNRICNGILAFEKDGGVRYWVGNYDYYLEKQQESPVAARKAPPPTQAPKSLPAADRPRKLTYKEQLELDDIEQAIAAAEEAVLELEATFADPAYHQRFGDQTSQLMADLHAAKERVATLYNRWEELEQIRQRFHAAHT